MTTSKRTDYVSAAGLSIVRVENGSPTWIAADHLGSAHKALNSAGNVIWEERYTPYGENVLNPSDNDNHTGFTGHIQDTASGLTYMQARYYDPVIGRFLSIDPVGFVESGNNPGMFNRYSYALNDPVNMVDPDGQMPFFKFFNFGGQAAEGRIQDAVMAESMKSASGPTDMPSMGPSLGETVVGNMALITVEAGANAAGNVAVIGAAAAEPGPAGETALGTTLFRAVGPDEAADIAATGAFRNLGSAEGKYFSTTETGARQYDSMAEKAFGDPAHSYVKTTVSPDSITPQMRATVDSGIDTVVVPDKVLPKLKPEFIE